MKRTKLLSKAAVKWLVIASLCSSIAVAEDINAEAGVSGEVPTLTSVALRDSSDSVNETSIDPTAEYLVKFTVSDNSTLADIDKIIVRIYESTQGDKPANKRFSYNFTYDETTNLWTGNPSNYLNPSHTSTVPGDKSQLEFAFSLYFKLDGIAVPTGATTNWVVNITVINDAGDSVVNDSTALDVNEYRSIGDYTSSVSWTRRRPGDFLENKSINPTITSNLQTDIDTHGANLENGSYIIPVSVFHVYNSTGPFQTMSTGSLAIYGDYVETIDSINPNIGGYTDTVEKVITFDGQIPNPQQSGTYTGTWGLTLADIASPA